MFDWSGLVNLKKGLGDTFQVPNLETGKMEKLITGDDDGALTAAEEEQFRNMVNRLHTIFQVLTDLQFLNKIAIKSFLRTLTCKMHF